MIKCWTLKKGKNRDISQQPSEGAKWNSMKSMMYILTIWSMLPSRTKWAVLTVFSIKDFFVIFIMIFLIILRLVITKSHQNESTQVYEAKILAEQFSEMMLLESHKHCMMQRGQVPWNKFETFQKILPQTWRWQTCSIIN